MNSIAHFLAVFSGYLTEEEKEELREDSARVDRLREGGRKAKTRSRRHEAGDKPSEDMPAERVH